MPVKKNGNAETASSSTSVIEIADSVSQSKGDFGKSTVHVINETIQDFATEKESNENDPKSTDKYPIDASQQSSLKSTVKELTNLSNVNNRTWEQVNRPIYVAFTGVNVDDNDENPRPGALTVEDFLNEKLRKAFVCRVLSIVYLQLMVTFIFCIASYLNKDIADFMLQHTELSIVALIVYGISVALLMCCCQHAVPCNFVLLILVTAAMSYLTAMLTLTTNPKIVLIALGLTAAIVFIAALVAVTMKFDLTQQTYLFCYLCLLVVILSACVPLVVYLTGMQWLHGLYSAIIVVVFTIYLMYDIQMLIGGKKYSYTPEDYVIASVSIYLHILIIFMHIINALSSLNK